MSRTYKDSPKSNPQPNRGPGRDRGRRRNISVRAVRRDPPDLRKLSRALISLAMAEAEAAQGLDAAEPAPPLGDSPRPAESEATADE